MTHYRKFITVVTSAGLGFQIAPAVAAVSAIGYGALDHFVIDKILPRKGPLTFINDDLTTIYKEPFFLQKLKENK